MWHLKDIVLENWHLKVFSLVLATGLWALIARESTSEIFFEVPVQYQNVPPNTEVIGDTAKMVQVRLRGPSTLMREITAKDISTVVDLGQMPQNGEKYLPLSPQHVHTPFGVEVLRVTPTRVQVSVETTATVSLRVVPNTSGRPAPGYEVVSTAAKPPSIKAEGPSSHVRTLGNVTTTAIDLTNRKETFTQTVDLDLPDSLVRFPEATPVRVEVKIRKKS